MIVFPKLLSSTTIALFLSPGIQALDIPVLARRGLASCNCNVWTHRNASSGHNRKLASINSPYDCRTYLQNSSLNICGKNGQSNSAFEKCASTCCCGQGSSQTSSPVSSTFNSQNSSPGNTQNTSNGKNTALQGPPAKPHPPGVLQPKPNVPHTKQPSPIVNAICPNDDAIFAKDVLRNFCDCQCGGWTNSFNKRRTLATSGYDDKTSNGNSNKYDDVVTYPKGDDGNSKNYDDDYQPATDDHHDDHVSVSDKNCLDYEYDVCFDKSGHRRLDNSFVDKRELSSRKCGYWFDQRQLTSSERSLKGYNFNQKCQCVCAEYCCCNKDATSNDSGISQKYSNKQTKTSSFLKNSEGNVSSTSKMSLNKSRRRGASIFGAAILLCLVAAIALNRKKISRSMQGMGQPFTARLTRMHLVTKMRDLINAKNSDHEVTNAHGGTDFRAI